MYNRYSPAGIHARKRYIRPGIHELNTPSEVKLSWSRNHLNNTRVHLDMHLVFNHFPNDLASMQINSIHLLTSSSTVMRTITLDLGRDSHPQPLGSLLAQGQQRPGSEQLQHANVKLHHPLPPAAQLDRHETIETQVLGDLATSMLNASLSSSGSG